MKLNGIDFRDIEKKYFFDCNIDVIAPGSNAELSVGGKSGTLSTVAYSGAFTIRLACLDLVIR